MREVANFMGFYPAYQLRGVLDEYALTFFALLNEGYRRQHRHYRMLSHIADLPGMDKKARQDYYNSLKWAAAEPDDILKPSGEGSSDAEIRRTLGG